jgi:hypothetical protein
MVISLPGIRPVGSFVSSIRFSSISSAVAFPNVPLQAGNRIKAWMIGLAVGIAVLAPTAAAADNGPEPPGRHASSLAGLASSDLHAPRSPCDRPSSSKLLETGKVRVYALPEEPTGHPAHRNPTIAGRPVFGCLKATGRTLLLDLPEAGEEKRALWVEVDSQVLAANGPLVGYAYTEYYLDTHVTWVRVRDLRTGAVIRSCFVGGGMAPHRLPRVTDIVLSSSGAVGWDAEGEEPGASENHLPGCNPTA